MCNVYFNEVFVYLIRVYFYRKNFDLYKYLGGLLFYEIFFYLYERYSILSQKLQKFLEKIREVCQKFFLSFWLNIIEKYFKY